MESSERSLQRVGGWSAWVGDRDGGPGDVAGLGEDVVANGPQPESAVSREAHKLELSVICDVHDEKRSVSVLSIGAFDRRARLS